MNDLGNKKALAHNLRQLMDERKVSAKELSKTLGFPYTTLLSWLKADNYPRIDKIEDMARYFGVMKSDLIEEKMTMEKDKDNDAFTNIIVRMRTDKEFLNAVEALNALDSAKIKGVVEMLKAFQQ